MKKEIGLLISILLLVLCLTFAAQAADIEGLDHYYGRLVNPLYADVIEESPVDLMSFRMIKTSASEKASAQAVKDAREGGEALREAMVNRCERFALAFHPDLTNASQEEFNQWCRTTCIDVQTIALEHTGKPKEGDYLAYQYGEMLFDCYAYNDEDGFCIEMVFTIVYYTTSAQEKEVTERVEEVMNSLKIDTSSEFGKILRIYDWICANVTYDYVNKNNTESKRQYTAYAALIDGTSVCQGYANLFYRMALEAGVDARIISGIGYGNTESESGSKHTWNIVKIGDLYYNVDATWDSAVVETVLENGQEMTVDLYEWFLRGSSFFLQHDRSDGSGEGDFLDYTSESFNSEYPMAIEIFTFPIYSDITSTSVSFDGKLFLNTYIVLSDEIMADDNAYVSVVFNSVTVNHSVKDLLKTLDGKGRVKVSQEVYAVMMHDEMTLTIYNSDGNIQCLSYKDVQDVTNGFVYSAWDYLEACLSPSSSVSDKMKSLARAAELYGIAAQVKFNYKTDQLTEEDINTMKFAANDITIPSTCAEVLSGTLPDGVTKRTKTAMFESDNALRMYFYFDDANLSKYTFMLDGNTVTPEKKESGRYYMEQLNIASGLLSKTYTFTIRDNSNIYTMASSVLSYAYDLQQKSSDANMINLAKFLYRYHQAADVYFAKQK